MLLCLRDIYTLQVISPAEICPRGGQDAGRPQGSVLGPLARRQSGRVMPTHTEMLYERMETCCVSIILLSSAPGRFLSDTSRSTARSRWRTRRGRKWKRAKRWRPTMQIFAPLVGIFVPVITLAAPTTVITTMASSPQLRSAPQRSTAALLRLLILSVH